MSYFRSYFEKNNTILKNLQVNTAKNPTTEIFYGGGFSKFIFKVDFTELKKRIDDGTYVINDGTTHTLHLTNTIFGDEGLKGGNRTTGRNRATSFDLILFKINEFWDEGVGFDYSDQPFDFSEIKNKTFDERPSNWFYRTTLNTWTNPGVYDIEPEIIDTIHFDNGNEDINVDITDYVNGILISGNTNHGMGLAFSVLYQDLPVEIEESVAFFTKYTQTFFEPYVETYFNDLIVDNRYDFVESTQQNLYLYVTKGSNFYNLDENPIVDILDSGNRPIPDLENLPTEHVRKGVYKVSFALNGVGCDGKRFFYDSWKNVFLDGSQEMTIKQRFLPKNVFSKYTIGENQIKSRKYKIQFYGIKYNEKIISGDVRKVLINFKSIDNPYVEIFNDVFYRIYVKEGHTQVSVHDWTPVEVTNENFFFLDTSYLIPREYFMEIKANIHGEEIHLDDTLKFEIVSEK